MDNKCNIKDYNKLLELQKNYESNIIGEDDMTLEQIKELIKLYKAQIKILKNNIQRKVMFKKLGDKL